MKKYLLTPWHLVTIGFLLTNLVLANAGILEASRGGIQYGKPSQAITTPLLDIDPCDLQDVYCIGEDVESTIEHYAKEYGVDPNLMKKLAWCESRWHWDSVGDHGKSFGIWQIHLGWHPDITRVQAQDLNWSTNWTASMISRGYLHRWTCGRMIQDGRI